jgi:hypothetical protein
MENSVMGDMPHWLRDTPLSTRVGTNFRDKLGRYTSLADSGHSLFFFNPSFMEENARESPESGCD